MKYYFCFVFILLFEPVFGIVEINPSEQSEFAEIQERSFTYNTTSSILSDLSLLAMSPKSSELIRPLPLVMR